jgi:hypothetical protein
MGSRAPRFNWDFFSASPVVTVAATSHGQLGAELLLGNFDGNLMRVHYCTYISILIFI